MTDTTSSGVTPAPAADTSAPAAHAETPAGAFGSTRGSGLARGRRPTGAAAPTATPAKADYKPTAVQVITTQREYQNPFASPEPANAPASAPAPIEAPAQAAAAVEPPQPAVAALPEAAVAPAAPETPAPVAERSEIEILPPAEAVRPSVSWESPSASSAASAQERPERAQRDDRPTFRPDRRPEPGTDAPQQDGRGRRFESRDPRRDPYRGQPRDPRDEDPQFEQRPRRDHGYQAAPAPAAPEPKPKGLIAWLKGLFGGAKPAETPVVPRPSEGQFGDGQRPRRRHRGGRGHGAGPQGFRGDRPEGPSPGGEFENRGADRQGGPRRRRHRGGRGRDRGGDFRSEGQQGGGAI